MKTEKILPTEIHAKATTATLSERLPQQRVSRKRRLSIFLTFVLILLAAIPAQATIVITASEVGENVVFNLSGDVNLNSFATFAGSGTGFAAVGIEPTTSNIAFGSGPIDIYTLSSRSGPSEFGPGADANATSTTGAAFGFFPYLYNPPLIAVPQGSDGFGLAASITFESTTFASLGVNPGTYEWTWSTGGVSDNLILNIGPVTNTPPTANAGLDQSIHAGNTFNLDGSLSFDDNTASTALQYSWSFTEQPAGSSATLSNADTATPSFVADLDGNYVVQLIVTDEEGLASAPDEVLISSFNQAPTAFATASTTLPMVGAVVTLDGSTSSDPDSDPLTYSWTVTSAPDGSVAGIVDADASMATFTPDVLGEYEITLTVSDFLGAGTPATVTLVAGDAAQYAEDQIIAAAAIVAELPQSQITRPGNRRDFEALLRQSVNYLRDGDVPSAIHELTKAIGRTDGCALRGTPDGSGPGFDWISDCAGQEPVYDDLTAALNALQP
jgi:K319L-like, PKD domain